MARYRIETLLPLDRNAAPGAGQAPDVMVNLTDGRAGGLTPVGRKVLDSSLRPGHLIGLDRHGYASFIPRTDEGGCFRVLRPGPDPESEYTLHGLPTPLGHAAHVQGFGAYFSPGWFLGEMTGGASVQRRDGIHTAAQTVFQDYSYQEEGRIPWGAYYAFALEYHQTGAGKLVRGIHPIKRALVHTNSGVLRFDPGNVGSKTKLDVFLIAPPRGVPWRSSLPILVGTFERGDTALELQDVPIGISVGDAGRFALAAYNGSAITHQGRVFAQPSDLTQQWAFRGCGAEEFRFSRNTLVVSDPGYVNLVAPNSYVDFQGKHGEAITGLASTPGGLIVFFEDSAEVVQGDNAPYRVRPLVGGVGMDAGTQPAEYGGAVFVIWRGRLYAVTPGGGAKEVGRPAWLPQDPFKQVVSDPKHRSLVLVTDTQRVWRYHPETNFWGENAITRGGFPSDTETNGVTLIPSPEHYGARYATREPGAAPVSATIGNFEYEDTDFPDLPGDRELPHLYTPQGAFGDHIDPVLDLNTVPEFPGALDGARVRDWTDGLYVAGVGGRGPADPSAPDKRPLLIPAARGGFDTVLFDKEIDTQQLLYIGEGVSNRLMQDARFFCYFAVWARQGAVFELPRNTGVGAWETNRSLFIDAANGLANLQYEQRLTNGTLQRVDLAEVSLSGSGTPGFWGAFFVDASGDIDIRVKTTAGTTFSTRYINASNSPTEGDSAGGQVGVVGGSLYAFVKEGRMEIARLGLALVPGSDNEARAAADWFMNHLDERYREIPQ